MSMSPEQMRKKSLAQDEAHRHAIYGAVDGYKGRMTPPPSKAIEEAEERVERATKKEERDIDGEGHPINEGRY